MEGMTNGVAVGQQQASGLSDISAQVQQYQQFLGKEPTRDGEKLIRSFSASLLHTEDCVDHRVSELEPEKDRKHLSFSTHSLTASSLLWLQDMEGGGVDGDQEAVCGGWAT